MAALLGMCGQGKLMKEESNCGENSKCASMKKLYEAAGA